jgi:hypothetical protein
MAALDILNIVVKPTLRIAVEFTPVVPAPDDGYRITVAHDAYIVTATGDGPIIECQLLRHGHVYGVTVTALYTPEADVVGASTNVTVAPVVSASAILRQKLYDILSAASISLDGRALTIPANKYGIPKTYEGKEPVAQNAPILQIGTPFLVGSEFSSGFSRTDVYAVDLMLFEASGPTDDGNERAILLMEKIRNAVDSTSNLGIGYLITVDKSWQWAAASEPERVKDGLMLTYRLTLPVQTQIGKLPYQRNT